MNWSRPKHGFRVEFEEKPCKTISTNVPVFRFVVEHGRRLLVLDNMFCERGFSQSCLVTDPEDSFTALSPIL